MFQHFLSAATQTKLLTMGRPEIGDAETQVLVSSSDSIDLDITLQQLPHGVLAPLCQLLFN